MSAGRKPLDHWPQLGGQETGHALYPSRSALAAAVLTRLALGRKSLDNIGVIAVDLNRSRRIRGSAKGTKFEVTRKGKKLPFCIVGWLSLMRKQNLQVMDKIRKLPFIID